VYNGIKEESVKRGTRTREQKRKRAGRKGTKKGGREEKKRE